MDNISHNHHYYTNNITAIAPTAFFNIPNDNINEEINDEIANQYVPDGNVQAAQPEPGLEPEEDDISDTSSNNDGNNTNDQPTTNEPAAEPTFEEAYRTTAEQIDQTYGARISSQDLLPRKLRDYGHLHTTLEHTAMTQYSVKKDYKYLVKQEWKQC